MPIQLNQVADLIDVAIQLVPVGKQVHIRVLKCTDDASDHPDLVLDPSTMLIQEEG